VAKQGKFEATTTDGANTVMTMDVKQSPGFSTNLWSVFQSCKESYTIFFSWDTSHIQHEKSGRRIPLVRTGKGWDLALSPTTATSRTFGEVR
jgi:hypothetical protein